VFDEKLAWDDTFMIYIRKSRDVYTKEKGNKNFISPSKMIPNVAPMNNLMPW